MSISLDINKGKKLADFLYKSFSTTGIHGKTEMPEDEVPKGMERGSLDHVLFITLTVSIDYVRDAPALWESARKTFEDPETRYLFNPKSIFKANLEDLSQDMRKYGLLKRPKNDLFIWRTVGITFETKWNGDPRNFLESCKWDSLLVLDRLKDDTHIYNNRKILNFPYLRGPKIGPLWLRMLRDNVGLTKLKNLDKVPIPVDIHIARATLVTGVVHGEFDGKLDDLFHHIRKAWFESVKDLKIDDKKMIALDVDEPLWHLSKYGCTKRDKNTGRCPVYNKCEAKEYCIKGKVSITKGDAYIKTWK